MSFKAERFKRLKGQDFSGKTIAQSKQLFKDVLEDGIYGLCFSAYEEGQEPGVILSAEQVRRRLSIIAPHIKAVRSFSCIEGNELISFIKRISWIHFYPTSPIALPRLHLEILSKTHRMRRSKIIRQLQLQPTAEHQ